MITARVLALAHPDDRRDISARFDVALDAHDIPSILVAGIDTADIAAADLSAVARALTARGVRAATALNGEAADLLLVGVRPSSLAAIGSAAPPLANAAARALARAAGPPPPLAAGSHRLPMDRRPLIVGILNATPDSFYDGGRHFGVERAMARVEEMLDEGVDVIEVGGETARPSVPVISAEEEIGRVRPVIDRVRARTALPIAVDTYKPEVARAAVDAGASIINDISGLADPAMADVAARTGAALVVSHIQGRPKVANDRAQYARVMDEVYAFLAERVERAVALGVPRASLVVDPGFSFGKQAAHDVTVARRLAELRGIGVPIYLAASRKNFIRDLLHLPFDECLEGTMAVVACGVLAGANLIRTHDVRAMRRMVEMLWAILGPTPAVRQRQS